MSTDELKSKLWQEAFLDTPRTDCETWRADMDAADSDEDIYIGQTKDVSADFARELERELNYAKAKLEEAKKLLGEIMRGEVNPEDEAEKFLREYGEGKA